MKLFLIKSKTGTLAPVHDDDREKLKKWPAGEMLQCSVTVPRNVGFHRKYFAMLQLVFDNLPETKWKVGNNKVEIRTVDELLWHVKFQAGHYEQKMTLGGKIVYEPKSISFAAMDDESFQEFYQRSLDVICKYFLPLSEKEREEFEKHLITEFM